MLTQEAIHGADFAPQTAGFIPGLGADIDCALGQAFIEQAITANITPVTPHLVDVTENERITVVPSLDVQAERAQEVLGCDLIVVWSAGMLPFHQALQNKKLRSGQRVVFLAPSVRHPGTTFDLHTLSADELRDSGLSMFDYYQMDEMAEAHGYEPPSIIVPGTADVGRLIAFSESYETDVKDLYPPKMFAQTLNQLAIDGIGTRIKRLRRDSRLDTGEDTRFKMTHAELLSAMRSMLADNVRVEVEVLKGGSHYFSGKEDDTMRDILSGELFGRELSEIWTHASISELATIAG
jgi:hypothetical protein